MNIFAVSSVRRSVLFGKSHDLPRVEGVTTYSCVLESVFSSCSFTKKEKSLKFDRLFTVPVFERFEKLKDR